VVTTFTFTLSSRIEAPGTDWDGHLFEIPKLTFTVTAASFDDALNRPETIEFCKTNKCRIGKCIKKVKS
jgi:hypothetical protein